MLSDATLVVRPGPHHGSAPSVSRRRQHALRTTVAASIRLGDFGTTCAGTSALFDLTDECGRQQADVSSKPRWSPKGIAAASQCRRSPALRQHDGDKSRSTRASTFMPTTAETVLDDDVQLQATLGTIGDASLMSSRRQACELTKPIIFQPFLT